MIRPTVQIIQTALGQRTLPERNALLTPNWKKIFRKHPILKNSVTEVEKTGIKGEKTEEEKNTQTKGTIVSIYLIFILISHLGCKAPK